MSGNNRHIRIAQQPPAIVSRRELFSFIAYFPKSSPYGDVQDANFPTYRSGGFATASVIPANGRKMPFPSSSSSSSSSVVGAGRADFNRANEDDRTIRFELGIQDTGTFIVVVRLHRQNTGASQVGGNRSENWPNSIVTSVVTRTVQVVDEWHEEYDTKSEHARYGRLTPPPMDRVEEKGHKSPHLDGRKALPANTNSNGSRDLPRPAFQIIARTKNANLPETEASGSSKTKRKENQPDLHIPTSTTPYERQNARRDGSEARQDCVSDDGNSAGANALSLGRLIMPRPNFTLLAEKDNEDDDWSVDDSDDEGGVKLS